MPEMGGKEIFAAMRKINPDIMALISSGHSVNGEAQTILADGAKGFIQKPLSSGDLSRKVAEVLKAK